MTPGLSPVELALVPHELLCCGEVSTAVIKKTVVAAREGTACDTLLGTGCDRFRHQGQTLSWEGQWKKMGLCSVARRST